MRWKGRWKLSAAFLASEGLRGPRNNRMHRGEALDDPIIIISMPYHAISSNCVISSATLSNNIDSFPLRSEHFKEFNEDQLAACFAATAGFDFVARLHSPCHILTCAKPGPKVCRSSAEKYGRQWTRTCLQPPNAGFGQGTASEGATKNKEFLSSAFAPYSLSIPEED